MPIDQPAVRAALTSWRWWARVLATALLAGFGPRAAALDPTEALSNYNVTRWDTEDGMPHNSVRHLFQTRDGFLWVATPLGLARFDGLTFTNFDQHRTPGFPSNNVTSMAETADGSLWFGSSGGLGRYQNGKFTTYTQAHGLKAETVNSVCVAPDGSLWIGSREGITRWDGEKLVNDINTTGLDTLALRFISVDEQGSIWVAIGNEALRYRDGAFTRFGQAEGLPAAAVQRVRVDGEGRPLTVTQNGLYRLEGQRFVPFEQNDALGSPRIGSATIDRDGNLWIGGIGGLDRFTAGRLEPYRDQYGNKLGVVDALLEDREGCLWVGTSSGLNRFINRRASTLFPTPGVTDALALAVLQASDGSVWSSTWGHGVVRSHNGQTTHFQVGAPLSHESVTAIYEASNGVMWLGNRGSSLDRLENGRVTTYVYQPGVATSRPVTAIYVDPTGETLAGIDRRGLLHLYNGQFVTVPEATAVAADTVWCINRTRDGRLFMGTGLGFFQRHADRSWHLVDLPGLAQPLVVRAMSEGADGVIWLATDGKGLVRWQPGQARSYDTDRGMVANTLFTVLEDGGGSLWVSSTRGIARLRISEFSDVDRNSATSVNPMTFGRGDGLLSGSTAGTGTPAAARLTDGRIMTATDKGVAVINPSGLQINTQPPTVVIRDVIVDEQALDISAPITISPGANRVEFRFTALSLIAPQRLRFRYRLQGSDPGWIEGGTERTARYTHLAPGGYTFDVLACNNDGVWSKTGASLALRVAPRYFQTLWFRISVPVLLCLGIASTVGLRLRQLKRRQAALARANIALDQRVRDRTAELSQSHAELQQREALFRLIFEHAPVGLWWSRADLGGHYHFNSTLRRILDLPDNTVPDRSVLAALAHPDDLPAWTAMQDRISRGDIDSYTIEQRFTSKGGRGVWGLLAVAVVRDESGGILQFIGILEDITLRKTAEQELANTYKRLMEASRVAGMAEVATGVLHNVGNVLNSVNVSATVLADGMRTSRVSNVAKLSALLHQHSGDLAGFLQSDPKGRAVLPFLDSLADHLAGEQQRFVAEVESLRGNVDHIKQIVARQQSFAHAGGLLESLSAAELIEDALRMNSVALARDGVKIERAFAAVPPAFAERHKVLQILINVLQNAKQAISASGRPDGRLHLAINRDGEKVRIAVTDNGVGIAPTNLTRIFQHGFTTKPDGHGFGLHSSANAAREMQGQLYAQSEGEGRGATFILELPLAGADVPLGGLPAVPPRGPTPARASAAASAITQPTA